MQDRILLYPGTSISFLRANQHLPENAFDLVYIDGAHTYDWVWEDCKILKHLKIGGIALFDDWIPDVTRAALDYFKSTAPGWMQVHNQFHRAFQKVDFRYPGPGGILSS